MTLAQQLDALFEKLAPQIAAAFREAIQDVVDNAILKQVVEAVQANDFDAAWRALGYSPPVFNPLVMAIQDGFMAAGVTTMRSFPTYITTATGERVVPRFDIRDPRAEKWIREQSSTLITGIEDDMRTTVRNTLTAGLEAGRNPRSTALDIIGRINPSTGMREGGVIGLGLREEGWSRSARAKLLTLDAGYFELGLRDKRFDATVQRAIDEGKLLPLDVVDKLVDRYRANALKHRGETVGRTETLGALNKSEWLATKQAFETGSIPQSAVRRFWDSAGDSRVRPQHKVLDGQSVGLDEPFVSPDGSRMMHPGDTSLGAKARDVVGCRCKVRTEVDWTAGLK